MPTESKIQLLVADDQEIVRLGLKALLAGTEIKVLAEAATGQAAVKLALAKGVDLVLLDVRMPDGDGIAVLGRLKSERPELPVLLFSAFDNPTSVARAIALGASGFLLKSCSRDELLHAVRVAAAGENTWSKEIIRTASRSLRTPRLAGTLDVSLSEQEGEVLRHLVFGLTNMQIAVAMKIDYAAVATQVQQILRKLGVADRTQAALWALRNGLV